MLESTKTSGEGQPAWTMVSPTPKTAEQLNASWDKLTDVMATQEIPNTESRKAYIYQAYNVWLSNPWNPNNSNPKTATPEKLTEALSAFVARYPIFLQLLDAYPPKDSGAVKQSSVTFTGTVPWWYWPLRVGAGIGAGLLIYRTLRPQHKGRAT
jgi:hypothetical protein